MLKIFHPFSHLIEDVNCQTVQTRSIFPVLIFFSLQIHKNKRMLYVLK